MGALKSGSPLRVWAGENEKNETDNIAVMIYRKRLPKGVSFEQVRKSLLVEIEKIVRNSPHSYWVSPKASGWLSSK